MDGLLVSIVLTPLLAQVGIGLKIALYDPVAPADVSCHSVESLHHCRHVSVVTEARRKGGLKKHRNSAKRCGLTSVCIL